MENNTVETKTQVLNMENSTPVLNMENNTPVFIEYPSTPDMVNLDLSKINQEEKYYLTEKIHGANFAIIADSKDEEVRINAASRNRLLPRGINKYSGKDELDSFFHAGKIVDKHASSITALFEYILEHANLGNYTRQSLQVVVYGELFGGCYNNIKSTGEARCVQLEVEYCEQNEFLAFDLMLYDKQTKTELFLDYQQSINLFKQCGVPYIPVTFEGSFKDALEYSNLHYEDDTSVYDLLKIIPSSHNRTREGFVFKRHMSDGRRFCIKHRNKKFLESHNGKKKNNKSTIFEGERKYNMKELEEAIKGYITDQRAANVLSKFGSTDTITKRELNDLVRDYVLDVLKDLAAYFQVEILLKDQATLKKQISSDSFNMMVKRTGFTFNKNSC